LTNLGKLEKLELPTCCQGLPPTVRQNQLVSAAPARQVESAEIAHGKLRLVKRALTAPCSKFVSDSRSLPLAPVSALPSPQNQHSLQSLFFYKTISVPSCDPHSPYSSSASGSARTSTTTTFTHNRIASHRIASPSRNTTTSLVQTSRTLTRSTHHEQALVASSIALSQSKANQTPQSNLRISISSFIPRIVQLRSNKQTTPTK